MSDVAQRSSGGIGFCGLLAIAFIVLKLCKVIDWSWVWVLAPLWIPLCIVLVLVLSVLCIMALSYAFDKKKGN